MLGTASGVNPPPALECPAVLEFPPHCTPAVLGFEMSRAVSWRERVTAVIYPGCCVLLTMQLIGDSQPDYRPPYEFRYAIHWATSTMGVPLGIKKLTQRARLCGLGMDPVAVIHKPPVIGKGTGISVDFFCSQNQVDTFAVKVMPYPWP